MDSVEAVSDLNIENADAPVAARPDWQYWVGAVCAFLMAALWLVAGVYKLSDLSAMQLKMTQLLVPVSLSMLATVALAISEVFAGVLLLRAGWRRWGGYFSSFLLLVFMAYVAINYEPLRGADCSCFPWIERAVGPGFFIGDGVMLALALAAAVFSRPSVNLQRALVTLVAICVLGGVALAVDRLGPAADANVPATITVDGQPYSLHEGKAFLYFFNPTCLHCLEAGQTMATFEWEADVLGIATQDPDFVPGFFEDAGLTNVKVSPDLDTLREAFPFTDAPYAVAIEDGQVKERFQFFEQPEFGDKLREHGFIK